jgi:hypothetical protein
VKKLRTHEWAWGHVDKHTVCGLATGHPGQQIHVMHDLSNAAAADRCKNCERMRAAIGTSRKPMTGASP